MEDEYKRLENLFIEKEKENAKLRQEITQFKGKKEENEYLKNLPMSKRASPKKTDRDLDTIKDVNKPKEKREEIFTADLVQMGQAEDKIAVKKQSSNKRRSKEFNRISPVAANINISNISNSRNFLSMFNNEFPNFENSTFHMESNNITQFNQGSNNQLNNLMLLDMELENYHKSHKDNQRRLEEIDEMIRKEQQIDEERQKLEEKENKKNLVRSSHNFRGSYENYFNIEDENHNHHFIDKENLPKQNSKENIDEFGAITLKSPLMKKDAEVNVNLSQDDKSFKKLRDEFAKNLKAVEERALEDKNEMMEKIIRLESQLNQRNDSLSKKESSKSRELGEIQRQVEDFKKRVFEELVKSQKESEKIFKKYKFYKEKYLKLSVEYENYKKHASKQENNMLNKLEAISLLVQDNEQLKFALEQTNAKVLLLTEQIETLTRRNELAETTERLPLRFTGKQFYYQGGTEIVNHNASVSNRSIESESESYRNERKREEERIYQLEKNLEILSFENYNLKNKLSSIEKQTLVSTSKEKGGSRKNSTGLSKVTRSFVEPETNRLSSSYAKESSQGSLSPLPLRK